MTTHQYKIPSDQQTHNSMLTIFCSQKKRLRVSFSQNLSQCFSFTNKSNKDSQFYVQNLSQYFIHKQKQQRLTVLFSQNLSQYFSFTNKYSQFYVHADELLHLRFLPGSLLLKNNGFLPPPVQVGQVAELLQVEPVVPDVVELFKVVPRDRVILVGRYLAVAVWFCLKMLVLVIFFCRKENSC